MCKLVHVKHTVCNHVHTNERLCKFGRHSPPRAPQTRNPLRKLHHHFSVSLKECHVTQSLSQEYSLCHDCRRAWEKYGVQEWKATEFYQEYRRKNAFWGRLTPVVVPKEGGKEGETECILVPEPGDEDEHDGTQQPQINHTPGLRRSGGEVARQLETPPLPAERGEAGSSSRRNAAAQSQLDSRRPLPMPSLFAGGVSGPSRVGDREVPPSRPLPEHSALRPQAIGSFPTGVSSREQIVQRPHQWPLISPSLQDPCASPNPSGPCSSLRTRDRDSGRRQRNSQTLGSEARFDGLDLNDNRDSIATLWPGGQRELQDMHSKRLDSGGGEGEGELLDALSPREEEGEEEEDDDHPSRRYRIYPKWL